MAISESTLRVTILMIAEQNKHGGKLGKKIEPVVVDPASNWPLFAEKAMELLEKDEVAVVFGCWTSVSRKSALPVFKKDDAVLFCPVQCEGEESSKNVSTGGRLPISGRFQETTHVYGIRAASCIVFRMEPPG